MPQPAQDPSGGNPADGKTLVRGADGSLYYVSKSEPAVKLTEEESETVSQLIDEAEEELARKINEAIPRIAPNCTRNARVILPEVFMD